MDNSEPDYNSKKADMTISNIPYFAIIRDSLFLLSLSQWFGVQQDHTVIPSLKK